MKKKRGGEINDNDEYTEKICYKFTEGRKNKVSLFIKLNCKLSAIA